jgi:membrane protease YdiL (CAAX protease family)
LDFPPLPAPPSRLDPASARVSAIIEIVLCSGVPSQFALTYVIALAGLSPLDGGHLSFGYVTTLLLLDATIMIGMILWFLHRHGEKPRDVFIGTRPVRHEVWLGLPMTGIVFMLALIVLTTTQRLVPSLHNVPENPLQQLIATRSQAIIFAVVATIGGGLREEIQRAFILHRFEQHFRSAGGATAGLVLYSLVFGLGHSLQGRDAVVTTTILGLFWGYVYLSRRSIVAPVVSHSGFNAAEIFQYFLLAK